MAKCSAVLYISYIVLANLSVEILSATKPVKQALPLGLKNQMPEEAGYLKFHLCKNEGEAYSASYLITAEHLRLHPTVTEYNLSLANTELASFLVMNTKGSRKNLDVKRSGTIMQSLDLLDLSVIHLSAYERLQRRYGYKAENSDTPKLLENTTSMLKIRASSRIAKSDDLQQKLNRTLAILPWLGSEIGVGNSKLTYRLQYLKACFYSVYAEFPNVVVAVSSKKDRDIALNISGLPYYDVVLFESLPPPVFAAALPVALVKETKDRILDGRWNFSYVYFTESDQILLMKNHKVIYDMLSMYPRRVLVPHRLMPYPEEVLQSVHMTRERATNHPLDWEQRSCCLPRQNCMERSAFVRPRNRSLEFVNIYGLQVALGNADFRNERYRACHLSNNASPDHICP